MKRIILLVAIAILAVLSNSAQADSIYVGMRDSGIVRLDADLNYSAYHVSGGGVTYSVVTPDMQRLYCAIPSLHKIAILDTVTLGDIRTIDTPGAIVDMKYRGGYIHATIAGFPNKLLIISDDTLKIVDVVDVIEAVSKTSLFAKKNRLHRTTSTSGQAIRRRCSQVFASPVGDYTYAIGDSATPNTVYIIDTASDTLVRSIRLESTPNNVVFAPRGDYSIVISTSGNKIYKIDHLSSFQITAERRMLEPVSAVVIGVDIGFPGIIYSKGEEIADLSANASNGKAASSATISVIVIEPALNEIWSGPESKSIWYWHDRIDNIPPGIADITCITNDGQHHILYDNSIPAIPSTNLTADGFFMWDTTSFTDEFGDAAGAIVEVTVHEAGDTGVGQSGPFVVVNNDSTPPTITITEPLQDEVSLNRRQPFSAEISDNLWLKKAKLWLDVVPSNPDIDPDNTGTGISGQPINASTATIEWSNHAVDLTNGPHYYILYVWDAVGNISFMRVDFVVSPDTAPPTVTITEPAWKEIVSDKYQPCTFTVTDNIGISRLWIGMIGKGLFVDMALDGATSFSYTFDPENLPDLLNPPANVTSLTLFNSAIDSTFPLYSSCNYYYGVEAWDTSGNEIIKWGWFKVYYSTGGGGGGCFLPGTPVLLPDGQTEAIETFKVGDTILAYDEETKELKQDQVKRVFVFPEEEGYFVINNRIKVTPHHRFLVDDGRWTMDDGRQAGGEGLKWKEAGELKLGDKLIGGQALLTRWAQVQASAEVNGGPVPSGTSFETIASIDYIQEPVTVYNLEVNPYHTFIAEGIVVHNAYIDINAIMK